MNITTIRNQSIAVIDKNNQIADPQNILDIMATAGYQYNCIGMVLYQESLGENFFNLKTGFAGEILQKFSNYHFKLAIVGDFSQYASKSLKDFIYECNKGNSIYFKNDLNSALLSLAPENPGKAD